MSSCLATTSSLQGLWDVIRHNWHLHMLGPVVPQMRAVADVARHKIDTCGILLLLDSHFSSYLAIHAKSLPNKIHAKFHLLRRFLQNSICSGLGLDLDSLGILPWVWCNTKWHHTNTKWKSCLLVWMTRSHAMSNFHLFLLVAHKTMSWQALS